MTKLLEIAIERVKGLPEEEQDNIAQIILEQLDDEKLWDDQFSHSQDQLDAVAKKVREDISSGRAKRAGWDEL